MPKYDIYYKVGLFNHLTESKNYFKGHLKLEAKSKHDAEKKAMIRIHRDPYVKKDRSSSVLFESIQEIKR